MNIIGPLAEYVNRSLLQHEGRLQKRTVHVTHPAAIVSAVGSGRRTPPTGAEVSTLQSAKVEDAGEGRPLGGIFGGLDAFGFPVSPLGPPVNISGMRYSKRSGVRKVRASLETVPRAWARLVAPSGSTIGIGGDFWWPRCLWIPRFSAWTSCQYIGNAVLEAIQDPRGLARPVEGTLQG